MTAPYKFTKFVDLLLFALHGADEETPGKFVSLDELAREIRGEIPEGWVFDAAKVLESRGLAHCLFTFAGTQAKITGEGRLFVEEERGSTREVRQNPGAYFVTVRGDGNQVVVGSNPGASQSQVTQSESPVFKILQELRDTIAKDKTLREAQRIEANDSLDILDKEAKKPEPNRRFIVAALETLGNISSIAGTVATLWQYV